MRLNERQCLKKPGLKPWATLRCPVGTVTFVSVCLCLSSLFPFTLVANEPAWKKVVPPVQVSLPRDHGSHPEYRTEWWYITGQVETESQRAFGYQITIFRQGLVAGEPQPGESALKARQVIAGHFAVADIVNNRFIYSDRARREAAGLAGANTEDMDAWIGDWVIRRGDDDRIVIQASDRDLGIALDFTLVPVKPLVYQGIDGYSEKGSEEGNASTYLSWTRLQTVGTVTVDGESLAVSGASWFDHEWGTSQLGENVVGWDWFGLQLDNDRELMVYQLRGRDGKPTEHSSGTLVYTDGSTRHLTLDDYQLTPLSHWTNPKNGIVYPAKWRIEIPSEKIDLNVTPRVDDAEMDTGNSTGVVYWEGPVALTGSTGGRGYMELTGYAQTLEDSF